MSSNLDNQIDVAVQNNAFATYERVSTVTSGTSANTFGTAVSSRVPSWARALLAITIVSVDQTTTAAQGKNGILRLNLSDLGISNQEFSVGPYVTSSPATNNSGQSNVVKIIPMDIQCGGNENLEIDIAPTGSSTVGTLSEIGLLYANKPEFLPPAFMNKIGLGLLPLRGGKVESAQQLTTQRTALTGIDAPSWAKAIVGCQGLLLKNGAITAGQECLGYFQMSNTLGITPFSFPTSFASGGTLGTPTGTGQYANEVPYLPCFIPLPSAVQTFTPQVLLTTAVSTGNRAVASLVWR